jgi:hypothetical protein
MNSGANFFWIFIASLIALIFVTLKTFRFLTRALKITPFVTEGFELTDASLNIPRVFWLGKNKIPYADLETVEIKSFLGVLAAHAFGARTIRTQFSNQALVLKIKNQPFRFLILTPKDPAATLIILDQKIKTAVRA